VIVLITPAPRPGVVPGPCGAGSLPRFIATCPAGPGLTVGSTLDGGPDEELRSMHERMVAAQACQLKDNVG
jgi:hypothetical protein